MYDAFSFVAKLTHPKVISEKYDLAILKSMPDFGLIFLFSQSVTQSHDYCHITLPTIGHLIYLTEILEKEAGFTSLYRNHNVLIPVKIVVLHYVYKSTLRWKCFGQTYYAFCIQWPGNIVKTMDQSFYFIPFVYKWLILVIYPNFISRSCLKSFEETVGWHKIGN